MAPVMELFPAHKQIIDLFVSTPLASKFHHYEEWAMFLL
jgi:hypothetical protein